MIPIIDGITKLGSTWLEGKNAEAQAIADAKLVEIQANADIFKAKALSATKLAEAGQAQDYDLDRIAMEQMGKSWKDEVLLIVFLTPMIMAFIPGMESYALAGFEVMAKMPEWYQYVIIGMVVVIYGMRGMVKSILDKNLNKTQ